MGEEGVEVKSLTPLLVHTLCFVLVVEDVRSQLPVPAAMPMTWM